MNFSQSILEIITEEVALALQTITDTTIDSTMPQIPQNTTEVGRESIPLFRINHAGEIMAQGLYRGARMFLLREKLRSQFAQAGEEEFLHLQLCVKHLESLQGTTSKLTPLSYGVAFALGAFSSICGESYALGFVAETERQVANHLREHVTILDPRDQEGKKILSVMLADEESHASWAKNEGGTTLPSLVIFAMKASSNIWKKIVRVL
ncbi:MAG: demethoxyubiquinone hydroxylase family protein [Methylacidiphilales bacterium]|nr:demethoxyubiquinone hydroxylase family protein [Candidatus Methylacidiphilales bacterium]